MQALLFADLTNKKLSQTLGGGAFSWPKLVQGDTLKLALRLVEVLAGETVETTRVCQQMKVTLGELDARPREGSWKLHIGGASPVNGVNVTGALAWNATPDQVRLAINGLSGLGSLGGGLIVDQRDGSYVLRWPSHDEEVAMEVRDNQLWPLSFVRVRASQMAGMWVHEVRLIQAPLAMTTTFAEAVPPAPTITALVEGGVNGTVSWSEVQKLTVPAAFRGVYCLKRGFSKTSNLSREDQAEEIAEALAPLADEDGEFEVTNPTPGAAHIAFAGSMAGTDWPLLTVEVFDAPAGDLKFLLDLDTTALDVYLRRAKESVLPLEIELLLTDEDDDEATNTITFNVDLTVRPELTWVELANPSEIDFLRPPQPRNYVPFTPDQVAVGILHWSTTLGDGVATVYVLDHNLGSESVAVMVRENTTPGALLRLGTDYSVEIDGEDSLVITLVGAYAADPPESGDLAVTILAMGQASAFNAHTHTIGQVVGLQAILDDIGSRLEQLEVLVPTGAVLAEKVTEGAIMSWDLPALYELYPMRTGVVLPKVTALGALDLTTVPKRAGGLLPAVHDAVAEALTVPLPTPAVEYQGKVYQNQTGEDVVIPGGMGRRSVTLRDDEYAACDGRVWYKVERYTSATSWYPADFTRELFQISINRQQLRLKKKLEVLLGLELAVVRSNTSVQWAVVLEWGTVTEVATPTGSGITVTADATANTLTATAHGLLDGTPVKVASSGTVPAPVAAGIVYYVRDATANTLKLAAALGGVALDLTSAGSGTITVTAQTGRNIKEIAWNRVPILEQVLTVTPVPSVHTFGCRITRKLVEGVDTITADRLLYGAEEGGAPAPTGPDFVLRGRLVRFDTEDGLSDARGYVALLGQARTLEGSAEETTSGAADVGKAVIKSL